MKGIIIALTLMLLVTRSNNNEISNSNNSNIPNQDRAVTEEEIDEETKERMGFLLFESDNDIYRGINSKVMINGYYHKPNSLRNKKTIVLNGLTDGEFIEFIVDGEIKDFEHVELEWDDEKNDLVEVGIINRFDKLNNQTIVIKTYMPEGIPFEKIKWKSVSGKVYEFIIAEYNLSGE